MPRPVQSPGALFRPEEAFRAGAASLLSRRPGRQPRRVGTRPAVAAHVTTPQGCTEQGVSVRRSVVNFVINRPAIRAPRN